MVEVLLADVESKEIVFDIVDCAESEELTGAEPVETKAVVAGAGDPVKLVLDDAPAREFEVLLGSRPGSAAMLTGMHPGAGSPP